MAAPKIKVKVGGKIAVEPEDPGAEVREERPKRGKRKRNELKAAHEVLHPLSQTSARAAARHAQIAANVLHYPGSR